MKKKVAFISGHFNVLHPGHLRLFRFAKENCDMLVVGVESDSLAGSAAHVPESMRVEGIQSNTWVDQTILITDSVISTIRDLKPDIVIKGKEFEILPNKEEDVVKEYGGKLMFSSGESLFSSIDLLKKEFSEPVVNTIKKPLEYFSRHDLMASKLSDLIYKFSDLNVCVIGDLIIDEYVTCQPLGMSQEEPTIVVTPIDSTCFVGGAGIVAAHAAGLGANVDFISVTGDDLPKTFALQSLSSSGVNHHLFCDESRPTTLKKRYRCGGKSMLRVSYLHQDPISLVLQEKIFHKIQKILTKCDLIVFSDFNYGVLPQPLVERIIEEAALAKVMIVADSQSSSQIGDISRFKRMDLITPTEREARIGIRNYESGIVLLAEQLRQAAMVKNVLLKLGEEGLLIHAEDHQNKDNWLTDRIPALNTSPKDVAGAGDSLLIASAMTVAAGGNIWEAAYLGSLAAAVQVGRVGNTPLQVNELIDELN
jgi:rfaE bifunctional protein kinase chain/domain